MINFRSLVNQLRTEVLLDLDQDDFRFTDRLVIRAMNNTILEMVQKKPILLFVETNERVKEEALLISETLAEDPSIDFSIQLPTRYREALMHGTAARLFNGDIENPVSAQKAQTEKALFNELLTL